MAFFKIKKWQSGTDAWGDDFAWKHENLVLEASSLEEISNELARINGKEIYASEYLRLEIEGECEGESDASTSARMYISCYENR